MNEDQEALARKRYGTMNLVRLGAIALVLIGMGIANGAIELPVALGIALAFTGLIAFFFVPRAMVKRWKAQDQGTGA